MSSATATIEILTAEVRTLQVGSRQITLSVYRQLDDATPDNCDPFGRVRDREHEPNRVYVVGRDIDTGALVRSWRPLPASVWLSDVDVSDLMVRPEWLVERNRAWQSEITVDGRRVTMSANQKDTEVCNGQLAYTGDDGRKRSCDQTCTRRDPSAIPEVRKCSGYHGGDWVACDGQEADTAVGERTCTRRDPNAIPHTHACNDWHLRVAGETTERELHTRARKALEEQRVDRAKSQAWVDLPLIVLAGLR